ncbi:MAG: LLM class flavin-dependent oxidoreductase [Acidimicrobiales bacterium mtb01]|nr:LLM class flavin-dependent oxidoreductase [Actinomycetota bacterium]TEX45304.1 MAG: LLM class flavin-dependent oxidoreductase [Acidimicrobiales bacterium mtb01]
MSTTLDFSVWPSAERPWSEVADLVAWAESTHWHGFWFADHFMPNTDDERVVDGDVHEVWTVLSAVAAVSSSLRLGSLVSPTTVRHPAVLANIAASLDRISNGRLVLGIGAGWQINEHRAYGFDLLSPKDRVDRFDEAIRIIRSLLTERRTDFAGRHFHLTDAACQPTPVQSRLPLLVGTGGPRMTSITVRHADEWNVWGTPETAGEKAAILDRACEAQGREPRSIRRSVQAFFFLADDRDKADRIRAKAPADRSVIGGPDEISAAIARYRDLGFDEIIVPDFSLGAGPDQRRASYERFVTEIIPNFR